MSGHSKWSKIKRDKGANDAKRGAVFTKIGNQIAIAAKAGTDPALNATLAMAIDKAKAVNMPLANIQRAIDRAADKNAAQLEEVTYEGYGQGGVAIIVEAATDNKNRTYPEVKHAFSKNGGTIGEPGSVAFQFERKGVIIVSVGNDPDQTLLDALEAGAEDAVVEGDEIIIYTAMKDLHDVQKACAENGLVIKSFELSFIPNVTVPISNDETATKLFKLLDALDELDDVSAVHNNADIGE